MQPSTKRNKTDRLTADELRHLWETEQYGELDERIGADIARKAILSALKRQRGGFDTLYTQDVFEKVLLNMDIVQLGQMAPKIQAVAQILGTPKFWEQKLEIDVPELFEEVNYTAKRRGNDIRVRGVFYPLLAKENMFEHASPKNIYLVLRFFAWKLRKKIVQEHAPVYFFEHFTITFRLKKEDDTNASEIESVLKYTKDAPDEVRIVPFFQMFRYPEKTTSTIYASFKNNSPISNYLSFVCGHDAYRRPKNIQIVQLDMSLPPPRNALINTDEPDVFFAFILKQIEDIMAGIKHDRRLMFRFKGMGLVRLVNRGYADKNDQGIILVGCQTCNSLDLKSQLECCPHIAYCSQECAYEDWKQHLELHH